MFTQARFALTSTQIFSRTDLTTDSEQFYNTILELLEDSDEKNEVDQLMGWWNRYVLISIFDVKIEGSTDRSFLYIPKVNSYHPKIVFWRKFTRNELRRLRLWLLQLLLKMNNCYTGPAYDQSCN